MVDAGAHIRRGHPIAFGILIVTSLISAIIASALTHDYRQNDAAANLTSQGLKDKVHFSVFTGWWSFLFSAIYLGTFIAGVGGIFTSIASHLVFLFLTWIFWVAAAGSLSAEIGGGNCSGSDIFYCNSVRALMAFDWINFIITTLLLAVVLAIAFTSYRGGRGLKGEMA